jgi:hypothetical protein
LVVTALASDIDAALGSATASDGCSTATVTFTDAAIVTSSCSSSQTRIFTAVDGCGNTATTSRTITWTSDLVPPVITATGTATSLGCNPTAAQIDAALGTATATDACSTVSVSAS